MIVKTQQNGIELLTRPGCIVQATIPPPVPDYVPVPAPTADPTPSAVEPIAVGVGGGGRKRIDVRDVFNQEDDDDVPTKKRREGAPPTQAAKPSGAVVSHQSANFSLK